MNTVCRALLVLLLGLAASPAIAVDDNGFPEPLVVGNRSPLVGIFGIPKAEGVRMAGPGQTDVDLELDITSHFVESTAPNEAILLDGETARAALSVRRGITDDWQVGVEIPWIRHGGGFLDEFIIDWHDWFGFRQRGRDRVPADRIRFRYRRGGVDRLDIDRDVEGIGDVVLSTQHAWYRTERSAAVLHGQLKLPTGSPDKLTGSGAFDAGAGVELARRWGEHWYSNLRAGAAYLGPGDVLPDLQRHWVGYGGLDLVWRPLDWIALRVQYDAHSPAYEDSGLDELSDWSGMLTTGGTLYITPRTSLDLAVIENVPNTFVVPDVTFQVRLRTTFGGAP